MDEFEKMISKEMKKYAEPISSEQSRRADEVISRIKLMEDARFSIRRFRKYMKVAVVIVILLIGSGAAYAAYDILGERYRNIDKDYLKDMNEDIQSSTAEADIFSRSLTLDEENRMMILRMEYEKGHFPEKKINEYKTESDVRSGELCYCYENECIYLPETELSDEQLLEIIEFQAIRDYALIENQKE